MHETHEILTADSLAAKNAGNANGRVAQSIFSL